MGKGRSIHDVKHRRSSIGGLPTCGPSEAPKGLYRHLVSYLAKGRQSGNWGRRAAVVDKKWGNRKLDTPAPGRGLESTSMPAGDPQRTWFPEMVETLRARWRVSLAFEEMIALRDHLDAMLHQIRSDR